MPSIAPENNPKVPSVPLDSPLVIEKAKESQSTATIPDYTSSPLKFENVPAQAEGKGGEVRRNSHLFIVGSLAVLVIIALVLVIYFFLSKYT